MTTNEICYLALAAAGVVVSIVGAVRGAKNKRLKKLGVTVEGVVFSIEHDMSIDLGNEITGNSDYYPVIRFQTANKEWVTKKYDMAFSRGMYSEGDTVTIIYNPEKTEEFIIDNMASSLIGYLLWVGVVMIATGVTLFEVY